MVSKTLFIDWEYKWLQCVETKEDCLEALKTAQEINSELDSIIKQLRKFMEP